LDENTTLIWQYNQNECGKNGLGNASSNHLNDPKKFPDTLTETKQKVVRVIAKTS
jgi:hypothetical protein